MPVREGTVMELGAARLAAAERGWPDGVLVGA
jgi:hypothetical protein